MPQAYAALIANGHVLAGRKSMVNVSVGWTNVANGGYQWALPGGAFNLAGAHPEPQTVPGNWHVCPGGPAATLQAINAAEREFEEETGLVLDRAALDVAVHAGAGFSLVTFTVSGPAAGIPYQTLGSYVAAYTALAQPLALSLSNPAAAGAVNNVRASWVNASPVRAPGPYPVGCAGFRPVCDFEFSELILLVSGATGGHLSAPQTYAGTAPEATHILTYTVPHRRPGRRPLVEMTLQLAPLPLGAAAGAGLPSPAQAALQIDWYIAMAGWL